MIKLIDICKTFVLGDQPINALEKINLDIHSGEYLSVMGPSGSGKSTLLNVLGLLDSPDSGQYLLDGIDTKNRSEAELAKLRSEKIGFVFQAYHLVPRLNSRENIELPMMLAGVNAKQRRKLSTIALERLGIADRALHLPNQLSGGQRQRVALARAIVRKPEIVLADEPTGNLDSRSGKEVVDLLEQLNNEGITLMVVTHDSELGARAKRQLQMVDGNIVQDKRHELC